MVDKIWYNMEELIGGSEERVLIETYWNVKVTSSLQSNRSFTVLIETYWNVKLFITNLFWLRLRVLIETYWNVKIVERMVIDNGICINRNILECKGQIE